MNKIHYLLHGFGPDTIFWTEAAGRKAFNKAVKNGADRIMLREVTEICEGVFVEELLMSHSEEKGTEDIHG